MRYYSDLTEQEQQNLVPLSFYQVEEGFLYTVHAVLPREKIYMWKSVIPFPAVIPKDISLFTFYQSYRPDKLEEMDATLALILDPDRPMNKTLWDWASIKLSQLLIDYTDSTLNLTNYFRLEAMGYRIFTTQRKKDFIIVIRRKDFRSLEEFFIPMPPGFHVYSEDDDYEVERFDD